MRTTLTIIALTLSIGALRAETADPMPVGDDPATVETIDGRERLIGVFDFVRPKRSSCPDGNCAQSSGTVTVSSVPTTTSAPVSTYASARFTPIRSFSQRLRSRFGGLWFPGKILLSSVRGDCGCGSCQ